MSARGNRTPRGGANQQQQQQHHLQRGPWMKNHPLEGDGLITGFFNFLHKHNTKTMKPCQDVFIPDTIVYSNNFPRGWYHTQMKSREITKRQGVDLDSSKVYDFFKEPPSKSVQVVASYISCTEENDVATTHVEFFNERTLLEFVERKNKNAGILQKFIVPKGGTRNTVIQAVWSPRVLCVWRRQNRMHLDNKPQAERDPYPMCVTYDGPSHFSEESTCASNTSEEIKVICSNIVRHFYQTMEHKFLTRMVLYFKVDEFDQLWLLWCGGLRVADKQSLDMEAINFAPRYDNATVDAMKEAVEADRLHEMDEKYCTLGNDKLFRSSYLESHGKSKGHSPPGSARRQLMGSQQGGNTRSTMLSSHSNNNSPAGSLNNTARSAAAAADDDNEGNNNNKTADAWHRNPHIHDAYVELCASRDKVLSHFDDIFYEAYGHFLKYKPGPFAFSVDKAVARTLGNDALGEAMLAGAITKAAPSNMDENNNLDDDDLAFEIPAQHRAGPVSKIGDSVKRWVHNHYDKLMADLKDEAASIMPTSGGAASAAAAAATTAGRKPEEDEQPAAAAAAAEPEADQQQQGEDEQAQQQQSAAEQQPAQQQERGQMVAGASDPAAAEAPAAAADAQNTSSASPPQKNEHDYGDDFEGGGDDEEL